MTGPRPSALNAGDAIAAAADFVRAIEMTTRGQGFVFADPGDAEAVAQLCAAAAAKLAEARAALAGAA